MEMPPEQSLGKSLIWIGTVLLLLGIALVYLPKFPLFQGKVPGDIKVEKPGFTFYFPLGTSILLSVLLSLIFWVIRKWNG
jgi:hypothetical protein